jgi:hypothetical protein
MEGTRRRMKKQNSIGSAYHYFCFLQSGTGLYQEEWALRPKIVDLDSVQPPPLIALEGS